MYQRNGFTLIELLVVVLIIGILSAVALPQYYNAVVKSRAVEALTALRALVNAEKIYYLANNAYTADITELDISFPMVSYTSEDGSPVIQGNGKHYVFYCGLGGKCQAWPKQGSASQPAFEIGAQTPSYCLCRERTCTVCRSISGKDVAFSSSGIDYYVID